MKTSDWINIKDRLPDLKVLNDTKKESDKVLLCLLGKRGKEIIVGQLVVYNQYTYWKSSINDCYYPFNDYITHWQPFVLP